MNWLWPFPATRWRRTRRWEGCLALLAMLLALIAVKPRQWWAARWEGKDSFAADRARVVALLELVAVNSRGGAPP